jgi:hypothetical protein
MFCHGSFSFENCICDFFENMRKCETFHKGWLQRLVSVTLNVTQSFVRLSCSALVGQKITMSIITSCFIAYHVFSFDNLS